MSGSGRLVSPDVAPAPPPGCGADHRHPSRTAANRPAQALRTAQDRGDGRPGLRPRAAADCGERRAEWERPPAAVTDCCRRTSLASRTPRSTPANQEVVPPFSPTLPLTRELPPHLRREDLARIELVMAMDGTVEGVRLISYPQNVHDSMWLSAVKAWQFQPALEEGIPVRYRKTIWIAPRDSSPRSDQSTSRCRRTFESPLRLEAHRLSATPVAHGVRRAVPSSRRPSLSVSACSSSFSPCSRSLRCRGLAAVPRCGTPACFFSRRRCSSAICTHTSRRAGSV